jgi:leucyl-tRNA synthetase
VAGTVGSEKLAPRQTVSLPVQINGKTRFTVDVPADAGQQDIEQLLTAHRDLALHTAGMTVQRVVIVPGRIASIVAR